ncbi:MAG: hypothetical protein OJF49_001901 [Ktedonobacterales bacterium]|jgi:hypothetical protein|nr:MAG: hypothetical protein OJF49_001901 [Ktedonobacterales bacterium]
MTGWGAVTWDVARAGGFTAYVLLTLSVALGLALTLRWQSPRWPRILNSELHNFLTLLSLIFVGVHVLAVWVDPFTRFGWSEVFLPFVSHYRPFWMALGIVALYLGLAIGLSTWLRPIIGYTVWRRLHVLTLGCFALVTVHGLGTGSDTRTWWGVLLYGGSVLLVGWLLLARLLQPSTPQGRGHPVLAMATGAALLVGLVWTALGPLRPGWNASANNDQGSGARVALAAGAAQSPASAGNASAAFASPFTASFQGTLTQQSSDASGNTTMEIKGTLSNGASGVLDIQLQGQASGDTGQLSVASTSVSLGTSATPALYQGQVTSLRGDDGRLRMTAHLTGAQGQLDINISLRVSSGGAVTGTVRSISQSSASGVTQ